MDRKKKYLPSSSQREQFMMKNGSALQEKLIATFNARYELPIRCFTAEELLKATNNFANYIFDYDGLVPVFELIRGSLGERSVIVAKHDDLFLIPYEIEEYICNIVMTSQLSHLKHVLKLVGCCLEFECPVLVYENVCFRYLGDFLYQPNVCFKYVADSLYQPSNVGLLTWKSRVKIAKEIAYTISYLHNAFPTPIIYRNLDPYKIIIDEFGTPKLFDFSLAIQLPPGEMKVELDGSIQSNGFLDPNCFESFYITPKNDVYGIGILLLVLITGKQAMKITKHETIYVLDYVKSNIEDNCLDKIVDCKIWESEDGDGKEQQLEDLVELALKCTQKIGEDRPDMIEVTKELCRIEKL